MIPNNTICKRISAGAIMLVLFGLVAGLRAEGITLLKPSKPAGATKVLSFPSGQCMGNLYLEPESGPGWDPEHVRLYGQWDYLSAAQGDVHVPEDQNVKLWVYLAISPRESAKFRTQNPQAYQLTIADRVRKDPDDLSGLSKLDPNDLFWLSVLTTMNRRTGADPRIFEPISRLTGLQILSLQNTGITDEGLEYIRPLRSLKVLELIEASISNQGLAALKDLPALMHLDLYTGVTDAGLRQVAQLSNLRWLRIRIGRIYGPGLLELAKLPRLERLCLWGSGPISDRHIKFIEGLTHLKSLTLWCRTYNPLTNVSLESIGKLRKLEELYFIVDTKFTVAGVAHLKGLKNLKKIDFTQAWIGPAGAYYGDEVVKQLTSLPNLESIKGIRYLTDKGMKTLTRFHNLKCLHIALKSRSQDYHGPTGVSHLAGLSSLEELHITGDALSDADLACLEQLSPLRILHISSGGNVVTDRSLASIGKLKHLESLHLSCSVNRSALNQLNSLPNLHYLKVLARPQRNAAKTDPADELMLDLSGLKNMKDMNLSGLSLTDSDLAFLEHLPLLENLMIQPDSHLSGEFLCHLKGLPELNRLYVSGLSECTSDDLTHLNKLPKLRRLTVTGDITDTALTSLTGPSSLESLNVDTDEPIRKQTVADLTKSHPVIEYIRINELYKVQTRPVNTPKRSPDSQPRINRRIRSNRRREERK